MTEPEHRRRRPAVSCSICRRRKIRCNRESPCSNCVRSKHKSCTYEIQPPKPLRQHRGHNEIVELNVTQEPFESHSSIPVDRTLKPGRGSTVPGNPSESLVVSSTSVTTSASPALTRDMEFMKSRIQQLEEQLARVKQGSAQAPILTRSPNIETITSGIAGIFYIHHDSRLFGQTQVMSRGIMHKTRLFGQSHWSHGVVLLGDILETIEPHVREVTSKASVGMQRSKYLARTIKSGRSPPWPSPPTFDLPDREIADKLVDCYLRTTETVFRILHIPTFRKDYEELWVMNGEPNKAFIVQVKLVLAIGAATFDEQFSLRATAIRWIFEAQTWLSAPALKSRLNLQSLQINLLLLAAQEVAGVAGDMIYITTGSLLKTAIYMGLHRDPAFLPKKTTYVAEMRRRLWNTILEVTLQSSMDSGGPPLLCLEDFDTDPPGNFDDDELLTENPTPKPEYGFTQASTAMLLRKTFPLRLAIVKFLNDLGSRRTYEETLLLDAELRAAHKALCRTIQGYESDARRASYKYAKHVVDFIMHRYLSCLHIPFFDSALHKTAYAFSRKVVIETSLKIWCAAYPSSSMMATQSGIDTATSDVDEFARLSVSGSGFFRTIAMQACFLIAVEVKTQLQEEESLSRLFVRPDLLSVLYEGRAWSLRCIEAGETNTKGYLLICLVIAKIEGLMRGLGSDEFPELLAKSAEEAEEKCLPILEAQVISSQTQGAVDGYSQVFTNTPSGLMNDWDFMISDEMFGFIGTDPTSWAFNDSTTQ